jgi:hypothetical protein
MCEKSVDCHPEHWIEEEAQEEEWKVVVPLCH